MKIFCIDRKHSKYPPTPLKIWDRGFLFINIDEEIKVWRMSYLK